MPHSAPSNPPLEAYKSGTSLVVDQVHCLLSSKSMPLVAPTSFDSDERDKHWQGKCLRPATILNVDADRDTIHEGGLSPSVEDMLSRDDVFNRGFLSTVLFRIHATDCNRVDLSEEARTLLAGWDARVHFIRCDTKLSNAPYFLSGTNLYEAMRAYQHPQAAFMYGLTTSIDDPST